MKAFPFNRSLFLLILILLPAPSCTKKSSKVLCAPCAYLSSVIPNMNFRVVDESSGADLFFGSNPPYKFTDLKVFHIINGAPNALTVTVDTAAQHFNIAVAPYHATDTVTMQIAAKPQDILLFKTAQVGVCCTQLVLSSVLFDGNVVYTSSGGPGVVVLEK